MIVQDLYGNDSKWNITGRRPRQDCSNLHQSIRDFLHNKYPTMQIYEEVAIKVYPKKTLHIDFFLPVLKMAIEAQGKQHEEYSPFFQGNKMNFFTQKKNDRLKKEWCQVNGITHVEITEDDVLGEIL